MQQDFADYSKRNAKEMDALEEENTRLKRRIETKNRSMEKELTILCMQGRKPYLEEWLLMK